jgi:hypothetical protein
MHSRTIYRVAMDVECMRLESFVQNFTTQEFKDTHVSRILHKVTGHEGRVEDIAGIYSTCNPQQKENLRRLLADKDHWDWRITTDGIDFICNYFLQGIDPNNLRLLQKFFGMIV